MLIRCSKESQHLAEWALGLRLSSPREQGRHNVTVITVGSKYCSHVRSPAPSHTQTLSNPFRTLPIKWEVYFCKGVFLRFYPACVFVIASVFIIESLWCCRWVYNTIPRRVIPKTLKMVLDTSLLYIQQYKVRIKGKVEQFRKRVVPSLKPCCCSYWKGNPLVALD